MAGAGTPKFQNDQGVEKISIGVKEFQCIGANPPFDHPHVYLDMGDENEIVCPYCSTLYVYNSQLTHSSSDPAAAAFAD